MNKPKVCIVGPGVVGQATGKALIAHGVDVTFIGRSKEKIEKLQKDGFKAFQKDEIVNGSYDFDITMFTVPTPTIDGKISLAVMDSASIDLGKRLKNHKGYHVVVVKSTVPPGTTENLVIKNIEKYSGKKVGKDFGACMNPEYLREETSYEDTLNAWMILIGEYDKRSGDMLNEIYKGFKCPIYRSSIQEAEMQKYIHNLFNAAKISYFNEMREIAKAIGADADKVFKLAAISTEGMWNPKYGIRNMGPFSGSCLPKDTQAFLDWAQQRGFNPKLLRTVIEVNDDLMEKMGIEKQKLAVSNL